MTRNGTIRRTDGQSLGSPDQVKSRLTEIYPDMKFGLVTGGGSAFDLRSFLFRTSKETRPYWTGGINNRKFILIFSFDDGTAVQNVRLTLYGRMRREVSELLDKLRAATGWTATL